MNTTGWRGSDTREALADLVNFVVHRAFYPVLMRERTGPHKARIERAQDAVRGEIARFRQCRTVGDVVRRFHLSSGLEPMSTIVPDLRLLNLPVIGDLREEFEWKVQALEPDLHSRSMHRV